MATAVINEDTIIRDHVIALACAAPVPQAHIMPIHPVICLLDCNLAEETPSGGIRTVQLDMMHDRDMLGLEIDGDIGDYESDVGLEGMVDGRQVTAGVAVTNKTIPVWTFTVMHGPGAISSQ